MRRMCIIGLLVFSLINPIAAIQLDIAEIDGRNFIVLTSTEPISISSYGIQLNYDQRSSIYQVESIEPFLIVANINNEEGYARIAATTGSLQPPAQRNMLFSIVASDNFTPEITLLDLYDENLNPVIGDGREIVSEDNLPKYQPDTYQPPTIQIEPVPTEFRLPWTPLEEDVTLSIESTVIPMTESMTLSEKNEETVFSSEEPSNISLDNAMIYDPQEGEESMDNSNNIPVATSMTFMPIIVGLLITMLLILKR